VATKRIPALGRFVLAEDVDERIEDSGKHSAAGPRPSRRGQAEKILPDFVQILQVGGVPEKTYSLRRHWPQTHSCEALKKHVSTL
jgi:hypothetical protein